MEAAVTTAAFATVGSGSTASAGPGKAPFDQRFERIASFSVYTNNAKPTDETVAEIATVTDDGMTVVYTDSEVEQIGFVDISDPENPLPAGTVPVDGEPTSVAVHNGHALVSVDADEPHLAVIDVDAREVVEPSIALSGQPDSIDVSPDGRYAAIAIENERDEELVVDGVEGGLPQGPAGLLQIVDLMGEPAEWTVRDVDLTGLADYGTGDPEPEYVDINEANKAVVTLQENNHIVVVDLASGSVVADFNAGTVDLEDIDATEDDRISLTESLDDLAREPDGVAWLNGNMFATANEGDLFGGTRGFSIFKTNGELVYDSGNELECNWYGVDDDVRNACSVLRTRSESSPTMAS